MIEYKRVSVRDMTRRGWSSLHAGAAETRGGLVLLFAKSGGGKSTFAAALANSGIRVADEIVFTRVVDGRVVASPLRFPLALTREAACRLQIARCNEGTPLREPWDKELYVPSSGSPDMGPVKAALFPARGASDKTGEAIRLTTGESLVRILEGCLRHRDVGTEGRADRQRAWHVACTVADVVPCYEIRVDALNHPNDAVAAVEQMSA
jgi:hypothetical protein